MTEFDIPWLQPETIPATPTRLFDESPFQPTGFGALTAAESVAMPEASEMTCPEPAKGSSPVPTSVDLSSHIVAAVSHSGSDTAAVSEPDRTRVEGEQWTGQVIAPIELVTGGPLRGDLLVRRAPAGWVDYLGVIVGDYVATANAFAARGIPTEPAGPGLYVEVAEVPIGGRAVHFSARQIADPWGHDPVGQTIYRPRRGRATPRYVGVGLVQSEDMPAHPEDRGWQSGQGEQQLTPQDNPQRQFRLDAWPAPVQRLFAEAGESGETETEVNVPGWANGISPFPTAPLLDFTTTDAKMTSAFATVTGNNPTNLSVALVDLTGNPAKPPYAGINDQDMLYPGSMMKIGALYAAFALKKQVQAFVDTAAANKASTDAADIFPIIDAVCRPTLKALFPRRPEKPFNLKQNIVVPQLGKIFDVTAAKVQFKSDPTITDKDIDSDGEFSAPGRFADWMRSMTRWSSDLATSKVVDALGYFYINGALADAGFFAALSAADGNGLWLSADYEGHDWVTTAAEKRVNAAGPKLTKRWADAQLDDGRPRVRGNITATAFQTAKLMTLMATDQLVDPDSSQKMRTLLASSITYIASTNCDGIGSYMKDALDGDRRTFDALQAKKGYGNDKFSHECGIVERTVIGKKLKYVAVVLGSAPAQSRTDLSAMVLRLDDAIIARSP